MNLSKNKIVLIGTTSSMMLQFRQDLIKFLIQKNWNVYTFICEYNSEELKSLKEIGAIPVTYHMSRGGLNPFADLKAIKELTKKIKEIQPDIVFSFFAKPVVYGTIAARRANVPKLFGMIEGLGTPFTEQKDGESFKIKLIRNAQILLYRIAFPKLDKIIFLNPDDPIDLIDRYKIKCNKENVTVLGPIGLDLTKYPYQSWDTDKDVSFIFIARLIADKGIFEYIEAAKIVKKQYPDITFTVIGGLDTENPHGLKKETLDQLINEGIIDYPGFVTNVPDYIAKSAVFVLPSYYREGVPRSTQEAMAIGRPVITTDVPGCRETVIDGVNGFLIPKWNTKKLAEKMIYFIENPDQVNLMGKKSYEIAVEKFDVNKVNQKLAEILDI